jgi:hypothetical protein
LRASAPWPTSTSAAIRPAGPPPITAARKEAELTDGLSRDRKHALRRCIAPMNELRRV